MIMLLFLDFKTCEEIARLISAARVSSGPSLTIQLNLEKVATDRGAHFVCSQALAMVSPALVVMVVP